MSGMSVRLNASRISSERNHVYHLGCIAPTCTRLTQQEKSDSADYEGPQEGWRHGISCIHHQILWRINEGDLSNQIPCVPTHVKPDVLKKITAAARSVVKRIEGKEPEPYDLAYSVEDRVLEKVNNQLGKMFRSVDMELSIGTPDKFGTLLATGWEVTTVERIGPLSRLNSCLMQT